MKTGVGIILIANNLRGIWMNQRTGSRDYNGYWQVPGGTVDTTDVSARLAAVRELKEEAGILVTPSRLRLVYTGKFTKPSGEVYNSIQFALLLSDYELPKNLEPEKSTEWQLIPWSEIPNLKTFDSIKEIFSK